MKLFSHDIRADGVAIRLTEKKRTLFLAKDNPLKVKNWCSDGDPSLLRALSVLGEFINTHLKEEEIFIPSDRVASFSDNDAKALGLPLSVPFQLRIWGEGNWNDGSYDLKSEFLEAGNPIYIDERRGAFIFIGHLVYRIPDPLFTLIEEVKSFPSDRDGKIEAQARISEILGDSGLGLSKLSSDEQIANIRIRHVAGFSAAIKGSLDNPDLAPVLFSKKSIQAVNETDDVLDETHQILDAEQSESFLNEFLKIGRASSTYVLDTGEYVYIDPSVRDVFNAFREICSADIETRRNFIKAPNAVLASKLSSNEDCPEEIVDNVFVVTSQFSDRVLGINKWTAPELPWLTQEKNEWGTDLLVFEQPGGLPVVIPKSALNDAIDALQEGLRKGSTSTNVGGIEIPISDQLLDAMQGMIPIKPDEDADTNPRVDPESDTDNAKTGPYVVETIDGFEVINYVRAQRVPKDQLQFVTPRTLVPSTSLMTHQEVGLKWLISAFNTGSPGVLIADDMGLGKTLQALVFLALYQQFTPKNNQKPCLIVAPTGLLSNWLKEISHHLGGNRLGNITQAFGSHLKRLKSLASGKDTDVGVPILNINTLINSDIVLTTYETLRDYQISFAQVSFGIVVFDEIQKIKNIKSLLYRGAAAVNGQFQIGLSGTPVENSLADLWTILDVLAPGMMKISLKDFMLEYSGSTDDPKIIEKLKSLQKELLEPSENRIPPVLRRLKSDVFMSGEMPSKIVHPAVNTSMKMPEEQRAAYDMQLQAVQRGEIKTIQALQSLKRISLAPRSYSHWLDDPEGFISSSGRLSEFFRIIDEISARQEKVLIFVESREVQPILAQVLKEKYKLKKLPLIINGAVSGESRQNSVDEFQQEPAGFNVMLISPKAGGVGLTLTAANNIVHLERWWNPAVEDQCNDRAYRIGQSKDVNVYTPVAVHPLSEVPSFDLVLDGILSRKRSLANSLFIPSELTAEDFSDLFGDFGKKNKPQGFSTITLDESYEIETGEAFEDYVADSLFASGFSVCKTQKSWDAGCDLVAKSGSTVALCQVKQVRSDKILTEGVDEIIKSKERYKSHNPTDLVLVTNAREISSSQRRLAESNNVIILAGNETLNYGERLRQII